MPEEISQQQSLLHAAPSLPFSLSGRRVYAALSTYKIRLAVNWLMCSQQRLLIDSRKTQATL